MIALQGGRRHQGRVLNNQSLGFQEERVKRLAQTQTLISWRWPTGSSQETLVFCHILTPDIVAAFHPQDPWQQLGSGSACL